MSRPGIEPGSQELASCAITARPPRHDTTGPRHGAFDGFQGSCYTILLLQRPASRSSIQTILCYQCNGILGGVRGQRRDRKIQGRQSMCLDRGSNPPGSQELASCAITARPPQHDITGPRDRDLTCFRVLVRERGSERRREIQRKREREREKEKERETEKERKRGRKHAYSKCTRFDSNLGRFRVSRRLPKVRFSFPFLALISLRSATMSPSYSYICQHLYDK